MKRTVILILAVLLTATPLAGAAPGAAPCNQAPMCCAGPEVHPCTQAQPSPHGGCHTPVTSGFCTGCTARIPGPVAGPLPAPGTAGAPSPVPGIRNPSTPDIRGLHLPSDPGGRDFGGATPLYLQKRVIIC